MKSASHVEHVERSTWYEQLMVLVGHTVQRRDENGAHDRTPRHMPQPLCGRARSQRAEPGVGRDVHVVKGEGFGGDGSVESDENPNSIAM